MNKTRQRITWICALSALLLLALAYAALEYYYPFYRDRAVHTVKAAASKDALAKMISGHGPASALSLRNYHNAGLNHGLSLLSATSSPNLDPPVLLYATLLLPQTNKEGIIYLFWLEYDFNVNGFVLEFDDGSTAIYAVFPVWDQSERDWFKALAHRDCAVKIFDGPSAVQTAYPNIPRISVPLDRLQKLRRIRLHLFDGRVSTPVDVFVIPEELRGGIDAHVPASP